MVVVMVMVVVALVWWWWWCGGASVVVVGLVPLLQRYEGRRPFHSDVSPKILIREDTDNNSFLISNPATHDTLPFLADS